MHAPTVAAALRDRGHDVIAVAEDPELRPVTDEDLLVYATRESRRIVTENVKDFHRLFLRWESLVSRLRESSLPVVAPSRDRDVTQAH